ARAARRSHGVGQRVDSLKALREAVSLAGELELPATASRDLRNEAIASLGLVDFRLVHEWPATIPDMTDSFGFDPGLEHYAVSDHHGLLLVRRMDTNQEVARLTCPAKVGHVCRFSPDAKWLAVFSRYPGSQSVALWDWRKGTPVGQFERDSQRYNTVDFSP